MATRLVHVYREARRRKVFRTAGLYVLAAWAILQVADVLFPGFGIPETAIEALFWAAVLGLPAALVFGWLFEIGPGGIRRTAPSGTDAAPEPQPLSRRDYLLLAAFAILALALGYRAVRQVQETPQVAHDTAADSMPPAGDTTERLPNSIAVLPFANISEDPANEYFCDGVAEEILNALGGFRELNVIGRTSSFAFKDSDYGVDRISAVLGVGHVLQGSVRKQGQRLRISAQLLDGSGRQLWAESFDRELADVFEIQSQVAQAVAEVVAQQVLAHAEAAPPPNLEAYDHYLAGRQFLHKRDTSAAMREFQRAIDLDAEFAEAHAEWAIARLMGYPGGEEFSSASKAIDRALELRPGLPRALAARGLQYTQQSPPDPAAAETILRRVLTQDPNMSDALMWLSNVLEGQGRTNESRPLLERAQRTDPLHPTVVGNLALRLAEGGDVERAIRIVQQVLQQPNPSYSPYNVLFDLYVRTGRLVELNAIAKDQALRVARAYFLLGRSYGLLGDGITAGYWFDRTLVDFPDHWAGPYFAANLANWQGDAALALRIWERSMGDPSQANVTLQLWRGALLARSGQHDAAIEVLHTLFEADPAPLAAKEPEYPDMDPVHALVWSYQQTGQTAKADAILSGQWERCQSSDADRGFARNSQALHYCAETALMMGRRDESIALLQRAIDAGWRSIYLRQEDPYWAAAEGDARYRALMAGVKADVDRQRAEVERIDAEDDFIARLDAARAARSR